MTIGNLPFSKGVASLGLLQNVGKLRDIDMSRNRHIDDMAILSLHNALAVRRQELYDGNDTDNEKEKVADNVSTVTTDEYQILQRLTVYAFQTSVNAAIEQRVGDLIDVIF